MKSKVFITFFFILLFISLFSGLSKGQEIKLNENEIQIISGMMDKYEQMELFSGVVLLAKNGNIVFQKAYGFADRESKIPNSFETEFRLASVSKLFTIVAILKLHDEGKLDEDDKIGKYFDCFSNAISEKVTIRHLITMTSGFGNYLEDDEFKKNPDDFRSVNSLISIIKKEKLLFEPGSSERYSNSGFALLGGIIERVTGKDYFEYIEDNICLPAGMEHTYFSESSIIKNEAVGYHRNLNGEYNRVLITIPVSPAGNAVSCAADLMKFSLKVCTTNEFLSDKAKVLFYSEFDSSYKGDWSTLKSNLKRVFGWAGGLRGVSTMIRHYIGNELTIIILSNYSPNISIEVWENIKSIMISGKYKDVQIPVSEKIYKAYKEKGIEFVKNNFSEWTKDYTPEKTIIPPVSILNGLGGELILQKKFQDAIPILKLNTELFPDDANTWDSLGEAYMLAGNKELAIENYEKSLKLNPGNSNAVEKLKELKSDE